MLQITDIVFQGNGILITFNDGSVRVAVYEYIDGVLHLTGLSGEQETALINMPLDPSVFVNPLTTNQQLLNLVLSTIQGYTIKIDNKEVDGLSGVDDSLAYKVHEIEKHIHNRELWYGKSDGDSFLELNKLTPWQVVAGTGEAFGTEVQLSNGDEIEGGDPDQKYDMRRLLVYASSSSDNTYLLEFRHGLTNFAASAVLTTVPYRVGTTITEATPLDMISYRIPCNHKLWVRSKCQANGATLDFTLGVHTYPG